MPHGVIDVLEVVHIHHQQCQTVGLPLDLIQGMFKPFEKNISHGQSRETIVLCHMAEPRFTSTNNLGLLVDLAPEDSDPPQSCNHREHNKAENLESMFDAPPCRSGDDVNI